MNSCHDQQLIVISYGICVGFLSVNLLPVSSLVIGVTTHEPCDLEFPSTMTNVRSGTWMMTGNGVMHNGTTTIDAYGQNLDKLNSRLSSFFNFSFFLKNYLEKSK